MEPLALGDLPGDDDPVVSELAVFVTDALANNLHLLQFPLRSVHRPYPFNTLQSVHYRPNAKTFDLAFSIDCFSSNFDANHDAADDAASTRFHVQSTPTDVGGVTLALGIRRENQLHLTPLRNVHECRPVIIPPQTWADVTKASNAAAAERQRHVDLKRQLAPVAWQYHTRTLSCKRYLAALEPWVPLSNSPASSVAELVDRALFASSIVPVAYEGPAASVLAASLPPAPDPMPVRAAFPAIRTRTRVPNAAAEHSAVARCVRSMIVQRPTLARLLTLAPDTRILAAFLYSKAARFQTILNIAEHGVPYMSMLGPNAQLALTAGPTDPKGAPRARAAGDSKDPKEGDKPLAVSVVDCLQRVGVLVQGVWVPRTRPGVIDRGALARAITLMLLDTYAVVAASCVVEAVRVQSGAERRMATDALAEFLVPVSVEEALRIHAAAARADRRSGASETGHRRRDSVGTKGSDDDMPSLVTGDAPMSAGAATGQASEACPTRTVVALLRDGDVREPGAPSMSEWPLPLCFRGRRLYRMIHAPDTTFLETHREVAAKQAAQLGGWRAQAARVLESLLTRKVLTSAESTAPRAVDDVMAVSEEFLTPQQPTAASAASQRAAAAVAMFVDRALRQHGVVQFRFLLNEFRAARNLAHGETGYVDSLSQASDDMLEAEVLKSCTRFTTNTLILRTVSIPDVDRWRIIAIRALRTGKDWTRASLRANLCSTGGGDMPTATYVRILRELTQPSDASGERIVPKSGLVTLP